MSDRQERPIEERGRKNPQKKGHRHHCSGEGEDKNAHAEQEVRILIGSASIQVSEAVRRRMGQSIEWIPSPHFGERGGTVDTVVVHYTVTGSVDETVGLFRMVDKPASAHYVIGKDGQIVQMVDLERKAWHAGTSAFHGRPDVNDFSVGIELVNWGLLKETDGVFFVWPEEYRMEYRGGPPVYAGGEWWDTFPEIQYHATAGLIEQIREHYPLITPDRIVGHGDVALPKGRKIDPGLAFDWERVRRR